jgi:hypothetical protein
MGMSQIGCAAYPAQNRKGKVSGCQDPFLEISSPTKRLLTHLFFLFAIDSDACYNPAGFSRINGSAFILSMAPEQDEGPVGETGPERLR